MTERFLNADADTWTAMDEWVYYPQVETTLSNILPCVDEQTTKLMLGIRVLISTISPGL